ncbi:hypothetical protein CHM34_09890 [Paludifilum halophilum]|uniref:Uncharacterized protein n=1 Tax=Paludifilum halophilum TaxID=1642702 RepID=A0A235B711_9BACL|nr:hypothetical protein CHM34_09890 [Paludifilum halophilum]
MQVQEAQASLLAIGFFQIHLLGEVAGAADTWSRSFLWMRLFTRVMKQLDKKVMLPPGFRKTS